MENFLKIVKQAGLFNRDLRVRILGQKLDTKLVLQFSLVTGFLREQEKIFYPYSRSEGALAPLEFGDSEKRTK